MASNSSVNFRDNVIDPITDEAKQVILLVNYVIICGAVSLFGIAANTVNIIVFARQGFKDSINISLLGLAVADLVCSMTTLWTSTSYIPSFQSLGLPIAILDVMYATGGWPHECFSRITSLITAFITLERCLCISMPLKVKNIITPFRTKVINISIFVSMMIIFAPFYFVNKLEWRYDVSRNMTILGLTFTRDREVVEAVTFLLHSVTLSTIVLLSVAVSTIILVVKLNQTSKWRKKSAARTTTKSESVSVKNKKVIKMVTLISIIFIICFIPPTVNFLMMTCYPQFNFSAKLHNSLTVAWSVAFVLEQVNSSVNMFVYFNMSSKFKATFFKTFCSCQRNNEKKTVVII